MKVSESWLYEWVDSPVKGQKLAEQLTMAGLEVDSFNPVAGPFTNVVVAKVLKTVPHPEANKLTLCEVDAGNGQIYKVVCGASNVRSNLVVALALPGAHLPGDMHIKETMLRGQLSQGMLCSVTELGLEESSEGIMELAQDAPIGKDLRDYLSLDDHVFEIDLTPNRADCFSIRGIAREVAALNNTLLKELPQSKNQPTHDNYKNVQLDYQLCPQYCGRIISGINAGAETPLWLRERLRRGGIRSIHPVVDVTNYVMLELGQPMHAFDLAAIEGDIKVRLCKQQESLELLDGQQVDLIENTAIIADEIKPLAIAGVMGGLQSAVSENTKDIFLESAFFIPTAIAGVARKYGLSTDSSQRFERGVDPAIQMIALERATQLLVEIVGGDVGPVTHTFESQYLPGNKSIHFNPQRVQQLTGVEVTETLMRNYLEKLGFEIAQRDSVWLVSVPTHRFDVAQEVDLVEEIIRLYGYDQIMPQPMITAAKVGKINPLENVLLKIGQFFKNRGYLETISYSFVDPQLQEEIYPEQHALPLLNPISQELSQMRLGLWPGLIASLMHNIHRQQTSIKLFESGVTFTIKDKNLIEEASVAGLIMGEYGQFSWNEISRKFDFYDLKGDMEALFKSIHLEDVGFEEGTHPALHPGQTAKVIINGESVGLLGVIHPRLADALDISGEVILFELKVESLLSKKRGRYKTISKYPLIRRDLSFILDNTVSVAAIEKAIYSVVSNDWLKDIHVFDVYKGASIPEDKKSIALALILQSENRTLVDTEINPIISAIIKKLEDEFGIILRD
ncbi:Phenylalanyl-tRNA synthetase beta subunit (plasmid) [Legionella adelaidensis]|uniref:Phenylalanine--tRNA ligase beta subunit n=1 Tax=Legionella adelaidensis TaxID=45056 RepID=A0A0W0R0F5_9GAMM|nr:phenylalanine--tRNA ligase subunit beta [Legionella adelaidensis]KTC64530.1 phenylalanyl-tRNA synthetase subunit beta [Legionella adelaidensis]VEH85898.1 Phenylalanyl-tRNA synthetase beta subunit [Legionella adelaidensis]